MLKILNNSVLKLDDEISNLERILCNAPSDKLRNTVEKMIQRKTVKLNYLLK